MFSTGREIPLTACTYANGHLENGVLKAGPLLGGHQQRRKRKTEQRFIAGAAERTGLNERIAEFYDGSSRLWEDIWGEHMHHGIYSETNPPTCHREAQVEMIEKTLKWAEVNNVRKVLDVGCGIGGSSRHIMRKYNCEAVGITLSPYQAARATELTEAQGMGERAEFLVADALDQPFEDGTFDLIWSMESGEHMPDKKKFVSELLRVCGPRGKIIIVTWCHRLLKDGEISLTKGEELLLNVINGVFALPKWVSVEEYRTQIEALGQHDIRIDDWTEDVAPFWMAVLRSALTIEGLKGLFSSDPATLKGALGIPLMRLGYLIGLIKFNTITINKTWSGCE